MNFMQYPQFPGGHQGPYMPMAQKPMVAPRVALEPPFYSSTRYMYRTNDGMCPNNGVPPKVSSMGMGMGMGMPMEMPMGMGMGMGMGPYGSGGPPPPYSMIPPQVPGIPGFCQGPYGGMPPPYCQGLHPPQPGMSYQPPAPPAPAPPYTPAAPPAPMPQQPHHQITRSGEQPFTSTGRRRPPPKACRVQGELPIFPSGKPPVLHGEYYCTFHIIKLEPGLPKPWDAQGRPIPGLNTNYDFFACRVESILLIPEFLKRAEIRDNYPDWYPEDCIGVTQAWPVDGGGFAPGSSYFLADPSWDRTRIRDVGWDETCGVAGGKPPVVLFLEP